MNRHSANDISAVILSAGLSSRMHEYKPLLPFGSRTIIETVIEIFQECHISDIVVVTGYNHEKLAPVIKKNLARPVFNKNFESGMLSSIQEGCKNLNKNASGFFLLPVDIPAIRASTVALMINEFQNSKSNIIMPFFNDASGHPPLIPNSLINKIINLDRESTLRDLFSNHQSLIKPFNVFDRGILLDADDTEGYERIKNKYKTIHVPDLEECLSIINAYLPEQNEIHAHLKNVTETALKITDNMKSDMDNDLVQAGAMLHDIKRTSKNHAQKGAELIRELGFENVADIIEQHMNIDIDINSPVEEKEIVYFADKIQENGSLNLDYSQKFEKRIKEFPHAKQNILKRYEDTRLIQTRIEKSAGRSIKEIFKR